MLHLFRDNLAVVLVGLNWVVVFTVSLWSTRKQPATHRRVPQGQEIAPVEATVLNADRRSFDRCEK
jgi:hypothetical protein